MLPLTNHGYVLTLIAYIGDSFLLFSSASIWQENCAPETPQAIVASFTPRSTRSIDLAVPITKLLPWRTATDSMETPSLSKYSLCLMALFAFWCGLAAQVPSS